MTQQNENKGGDVEFFEPEFNGKLEAKFLISQPLNYAKSTVFFDKNADTPIIEIRYDGDIFVKGELIENNIDLVNAFKIFFKQQGLYGNY